MATSPQAPHYDVAADLPTYEDIADMFEIVDSTECFFTLLKESFFAAPVTRVNCDGVFFTAMSLSAEKRAALPSPLRTFFSGENIMDGGHHVRNPTQAGPYHEPARHV
ncbi:hypothetical protein Alg130_10097 [Pyrenophora tritici-repentis]|nr:hypothetical protein Alg130_10097 [Pyrenophora tritici-repentis]KAI1522192.1 hypothetical protein PtrSN001A_011863 [Pyrenophora tritici-repentis]KAI1592466.1 hypothetical protein PtrCC142_011599 [Pyrenophora tritici-repentis]